MTTRYGANPYACITMDKIRKKPLFSIFCRAIGYGGTRVSFYETNTGLRAVWTNKECPYLTEDDKADDQEAASDGHNVSHLLWDDLASLRGTMQKLERILNERRILCGALERSKKTAKRRK